MQTTIETKRNPGCLVQLLWFGFVGWWLGQAWVAVAWVLIATVIFMPIGIAMLNRVPKIIALREPETVERITTGPGGAMRRETLDLPQRPFVLRALYFVFIGWWFTALWIEVAYALCLSIIGLPIGFWMFDAVPAVLTLKRS
jgi:uncharacterized membrane protein YccF (DUF307 family)